MLPSMLPADQAGPTGAMTSTVDLGANSQVQPSDRSLLKAGQPLFGDAKPDSAATRYLFTSTVFLGVGAILWLAGIVSMRFPGFFPISYGRLRPMALIALFLGWLVLGLMAGICYVLPRLTGAPLRGEGLANLGLIASVGVFMVGMVIVLLGYGDGREPFSLPWWWDVPTLGVLLLPAMVVFPSLRHRREESVYPTLWFVASGALWLPSLYLIGNIPGLRSLASSLADLVFSAGYLNVWALGVATGLAYYVVPKASGQPLANRQLARVGFWSVLFGAVWMGPAQLVAGPAPEWLQGVASVLGLALPVGAAANTVNFAITVGPQWKEISRKPVLLAAMVGSGLGSLTATVAAIAGFRSAAVLVGFTTFWEGILHLLLFGAVALLFASFAWHAIPNLVGRSLRSESRALWLVRRNTLAAGFTALFLVFGGLAAGYGWAGAAFSGQFENTGAGWAITATLPGVLNLLAVVVALLGTWYTIGLSLSIYQSLTSGHPTMQEVLKVAPSGGGVDE